MIPECNKIIAAEIQQLCRDAIGTVILAVEPVGEGTALKSIAAVNDERIAVMPEIVHAVCKTARRRTAGRVINRREKAVRITCVIYPEFTLHSCPSE